MTVIVFSPLISWLAIALLVALALFVLMFSYWRGLTGWALRGCASVTILAALCGPSLQTENRETLSDIVLMVVDQSASQHLGARAAQTSSAVSALTAQIEARPNTELRRINITDGPNDSGTRAMDALVQSLAKEPRNRIAGVLLISDGLIHDIENAPVLPAPLHFLQTGEAQDWDRRLIVKNAPPFAILGEPFNLSLEIQDQGHAPKDQTHAILEISIDGDAPIVVDVPIGRVIEIPVTLPHAGRNILRFSIPQAASELTVRNNTALIQVNGVRDRLRVLLISGEPHPGGRTWRNLLKSDSSVDLVHFTILRPLEKQDGVPVGELSLIAFPTRELFLEKIDDFDLIIFDRYKRRGILPSLYLENVRNYVEKGGAILVAAGPDFAGADSIYRSPLSEIIPASPSARVIEQPYLPTVSDIGLRHPVTSDLKPPQGAETWGRWMRQTEVNANSGDVIMSGFGEKPLLILDRVGSGRVALLASDHAWLWDRGFEGGGPQLELLRRLAHWMMKEPELEEDALWAEPTGQTLRIIRRTLEESVGNVTITTPSGQIEIVELQKIRPGHFEAKYKSDEIGLFRLTGDKHKAVTGLGPSAPREFAKTIANSDTLEPLVDTMRGGIFHLSDRLPSLRAVRVGRPAAGRGWLGLTPRKAYQTRSIRHASLFPNWLILALISGFIVSGWMREGKRQSASS